MTIKLAALNAIGANPVRSIQAVLWIVQTVVGLFILTPFYLPEGTPALAEGLSSLVAIKIYGALMFVPGLTALILMVKGKGLDAQKNLMFWTFLLFSYFAIIRIVIFGPIGSLIWTSYAINALTAGVVYLRLKWEDK